MRRFRRRFGQSKRRRLGWGWMTFHDSFLFTGPVEGFVTEWVRAPSGSFDPIIGDHMPSDTTLVRMLPSVQVQFMMEPASPATGFFRLHQGVIAWDFPYDPTVSIVDIPDPEIGAFDWVWRHAEGLRLKSGTAIGSLPSHALIDTLFASPPYTDVRSQRKLSTGTGLLYVAKFSALGTSDELVVSSMHVDMRYLEKLA